MEVRVVDVNAYQLNWYTDGCDVLPASLQYLADCVVARLKAAERVLAC